MFAVFAKMFGAGRMPVPTLIEPDALPIECATLLAGVSFADRGADEEGNTRLIVTLPGRGAFRYGADTASNWLREQFSLNDAQLSRALRMLRARLADFQRQQMSVAIGRGTSWSDWKPVHDASEL